MIDRIKPLRVLFVCSGSRGISPIISAQATSLRNLNCSIDIFPIKGKGIIGYLKHVMPLYRFMKYQKFDIVHAHYSLSAMVASLAGAKPLVVSLMGSDIKAKRWFKWLILIFHKFFWRITIVKSEDMKLSLGFKNIKVIPNGVDLNVFYPQDQKFCQTKLNWDIEKKHILFPSNPSRPEKNYSLLEDAINEINSASIQIHTLIDVPHKEVPFYLNAADIVVMTSLWEGSPNAIKEAMACNRTIVSTSVGDVQWLLGDLKGVYLSGFDKNELSVQIQKALHFSGKYKNTKGRVRIESLNLSSKKVASRLIKVYDNIA